MFCIIYTLIIIKLVKPIYKLLDYFQIAVTVFSRVLRFFAKPVPGV